MPLPKLWSKHADCGDHVDRNSEAGLDRRLSLQRRRSLSSAKGFELSSSRITKFPSVVVDGAAATGHGVPCSRNGGKLHDGQRVDLLHHLQHLALVLDGPI